MRSRGWGTGDWGRTGAGALAEEVSVALALALGFFTTTTDKNFSSTATSLLTLTLTATSSFGTTTKLSHFGLTATDAICPPPIVAVVNGGPAGLTAAIEIGIVISCGPSNHRTSKGHVEYDNHLQLVCMQ